MITCPNCDGDGGWEVVDPPTGGKWGDPTPGGHWVESASATARALSLAAHHQSPSMICRLQLVSKKRLGGQRHER